MLEVEMKFAVADPTALAQRLSGLQTDVAHVPAESRQEQDHYFNAPDRNFAETDEALRLRQIGPRNILTYKGPKLDRETKTRQEIEIALADGPQAAANATEMLRSLRYRPTATVEKRRTVYHMTRQGFPLEACLDEVVNVGTFIELEIVAHESELQSARAVVQELARELNLGPSERRSYLEMYLERRERGEVAP